MLHKLFPKKKQTDVWGRPFELLRKRWEIVPLDISERKSTKDLLALDDKTLNEIWETSRNKDQEGDGFGHRGWYRTLYKDFVSDKKILDVGCGFGFDGITFLEFGADVTFADIVQSNLDVVRRIGDIRKLSKRASFLCFGDVQSLKKLDNDFDVIFAQGSLHNAPFHVMKSEVDELTNHLKVSGRWLQLAYPKTRWIRDGSPPFDRWGQRTDGEGTPWEEWYDVPKLLDLLAPAKFDLVFYTEFHNHDFNWFDLIFRGKP